MNSGSGLKVGYVLKVFPRLSETFVLNEILELERRGVEVEIFSLKPPTEPRFHGQLAQLQAPVTYLTRVDSGSSWQDVKSLTADLNCDATAVGTAFLKSLQEDGRDCLKLFPQALQLAALVRRQAIDHLHAHFASVATRLTVLAHILSGVSFSFTAHAKDIYHGEVKKDVLADALSRAAFTVTVTDHNVRTLKACANGASSNVRRIYNGVDLERFSPQPFPETQPSEIVSVGRLVEKKGFPYLIEACRLLKERGRGFRCTIIGTGIQEEELHHQIADLDLEDTVLLTGPRSSEKVMAAISRSVVMVLPCVVAQDGNQDALPTVMLEAMVLGRAVVSTDLPGVTEIVDDGLTGRLAPQRDSHALADAIDEVLLDAGLRERFGRAGRQKAERLFDLRKNVAELASLFQQTHAIEEPVLVGPGGGQ